MIADIVWREPDDDAPEHGTLNLPKYKHAFRHSAPAPSPPRPYYVSHTKQTMSLCRLVVIYAFI